MLEKLLTTQEVAAALRLTKRQVQLLIQRGELPAVDLGHRTKRVRPSALAQYLESRGTLPCN